MYLNSHSCYSLRYGIIQPAELLAEMKALGYETFALTDINNTSACLDFVRMSSDHEIKPIIGIDFRNGIEQKFVGLAKNNQGFLELNQFLSFHLTQDAIPIPDLAPRFEHSIVIYPYFNAPERDLFDYEFLGVKIRDLNRLKVRKDPRKHKMVMLESASFRNKTDYNTHKLLRAIDKNTIYSKMESADYAESSDTLRSTSDIRQAYSQFEHIIENTTELCKQCQVTFDFDNSKPKNQKTYSGDEKKDIKLMRDLCAKNLNYRYPSPTTEILDRLEKELHIIEEKGFVSYFLINWDITSYAREKGYFYVGRGSGANSIVAYLLRITDVDPIELDLYFERFINLYRANPPDFDIDFSWKDREDITQYIFKRFPNTALLATYNTFQYKASVRELGKVFGLPKSEIDRLSAGGFSVKDLDEISKLVLRYASLIQGLPSMLSVHAAGILISELPINYYSATFVPPKGFATTQFDMVVAEDIGLYKFDILGQRGLAKIKDGLKLVAENNPPDDPIDIHDLQRFKNDRRVKEILMNAQAIGCFYVESPAMRMLLRKLKVKTYLGLVAASSIIRPGVAKSGMMREYILRDRHPEKRKEAHPVMQDIMPDTYGIMVYQEDVIKVAHYFAGLTLGEADVLRRGMSGKYRSREEFDRVRDKYFSNCKEKGYSFELSKEVWRQIESFAGYAFAKGHSASYAVESYQSLFLKAHYPLEYMVATINNGGGFYRPELYVHEARMCGGEIHAPCIQMSDYGCKILGRKIYLGLGFVHGLEADYIKYLIEVRDRDGDFISLEDFVERTAIGLEHLCSLIRINAFRSLGESKKKLLWKAHQLLNKSKKQKVVQQRLFTPKVKEYNLPPLNDENFEDAFDQIELLGFPLCSPFNLLEDQSVAGPLAKDMNAYNGKNITMYGYLITVKNTTTSKGERMNFGTFIDKEGQFIDTVHFPDVAAKHPFRGRGIYAITGKVVQEFDFYTLEVSGMKKQPYLTDPRFNEDMYQLKGQNFSSRGRKSLKSKV